MRTTDKCYNVNVDNYEIEIVKDFLDLGSVTNLKGDWQDIKTKIIHGIPDCHVYNCKMDSEQVWQENICQFIGNVELDWRTMMKWVLEQSCCEPPRVDYV